MTWLAVVDNTLSENCTNSPVNSGLHKVINWSKAPKIATSLDIKFETMFIGKDALEIGDWSFGIRGSPFLSNFKASFIVSISLATETKAPGTNGITLTAWLIIKLVNPKISEVCCKKLAKSPEIVIVSFTLSIRVCWLFR